MAQLGHLSTAAQACDGQGRVGAGGDDQMHITWQVIEQEGKSIVNRLGCDEVVVIENQDKGVWDGVDLVDQRCEDRLHRG